MLWRRTDLRVTRQLLRATHRLGVRTDYTRVLCSALCVGGVLLALLLWRSYDTQVQIQQAEGLLQQQTHLEQQLHEAQLRVQEADAVREQLLQRTDTMSGEIKQLKTELEFFRQQKKRH